MRAGLHYYLQNFSIYDYLAIAWVLLLFIVLLFLVIFAIAKHQLLGALLLIIDIGFLFGGMYYALNFVDERVRAREVSINWVKQLTYTDAVIVDANLTNLSKKPFKFCKVKVKFFKASPYKFVQKIYEFKPVQSKSIDLNSPLDVNQTRNFDLIIDDFAPRDYNVSISSECF